MKAVLSLESCERISYDNGIKCLEENESLINWSRKTVKILVESCVLILPFTCSDKFLKLAQERARETRCTMAVPFI